jgi:nucleoid-associated protein YgaU
MAASFAPNSRYAATATLTLTTPDGDQIAYLARRFVPHPENLAQAGSHTVTAGDRIDNVAAQALGDPELSWRLADANRAMLPRELTATPGTVLRICLPQGIQGAPHV